MAPRAEPTRHDPTALIFLDAAAQLIDAALAEPGAEQPARLRSIKFPPALDWIRVEDVLALARSRSSAAASKKAFNNRWPSKDAFVRDAILHCMLYRDDPVHDPGMLGSVEQLRAIRGRSFSADILAVADNLYVGLLSRPRSFLLAHVGPMLCQHPDLHEAVLESTREALDAWAAGYAEALRQVGIDFRPGWTMERVTLALQAILDGFVLRSRIDPAGVAAARWGTASLFADTVLAFLAGALDSQDSGLSTHAWLDQQIPVAPREARSQT